MLAKCEAKKKTAWKVSYPFSKTKNKAIRIINFQQQDFPVKELAIQCK